jgi:hypothetical protein
MTMTMYARLAGILVMTMMTNNENDDQPDVVWLDGPGISIRAPHHLSSAHAIPLKIDFEADMRTDDALGGFLLGAVSLALVRQDRPGILLGAAYNPHQFGYPNESGFGIESSSDSPSVLGVPSESPHSSRPRRDPRDTTGSMVEYQFGRGVVDRGSGRYFLLGGFAKWWVAPQVIRISDPRGPAPVADRPVPVAAAALAPPRVPPSRPILELGELGGRRFLRVMLPPSAPTPTPTSTPALHAAPPAKAAKAARPFFTIVGFHLQNHGGSVGGVFTPKISAGPTPSAIEATVSFASFAPFDSARMNRREIPGAWVFLLFHDDQVSGPLNVTLAKSDY